MTTIGTFTRREDGAFSGSIRALSLSVKSVELRPVLRSSAKAPDFRVFAAGAEIGAAWSPAPDSGRRHISVRLDDPSFAAPIHGSLIEADGLHHLTWTRPSPRV